MNKFVKKLLEDKKIENSKLQNIKEEKKRKKEKNVERHQSVKEEIINIQNYYNEIKSKEKKIDESVKVVNKIQENYDELKRKSDRTEKFIMFADKIKIDDKEVPKTEKGMSSKAKEIAKKLYKKIDKEKN